MGSSKSRVGMAPDLSMTSPTFSMGASYRLRDYAGTGSAGTTGRMMVSVVSILMACGPVSPTASRSTRPIQAVEYMHLIRRLAPRLRVKTHLGTVSGANLLILDRRQINL